MPLALCPTSEPALARRPVPNTSPAQSPPAVRDAETRASLLAWSHHRLTLSLSARGAAMEITGCPATKKRRLALGNSIGLQGINFLSLPEDIVSMITAEIPLKEAVRMSVVCSNLRRTWTNHPNLDFDISTLSGTKAKRKQNSGRSNRILGVDKFISTVNLVLRGHSGLGVNRLSFKFGLHKKHAKDIDGWISFAIASKARVVVLNCFSPCRSGHYKSNYSFPCHLFNNQNSSHLQVLRLNSVTLDSSRDFCGFSNITTLALENTLILQDLQYLLLKCPALEWLSIRMCPQLHNLHVAEPLPKLKFLCVQDCAIKKMDLHAHNLSSFQYRGDSDVSFFALKECLNLKQASIALYVEHNLEYIFTGLPNGFPHVETLHVKVFVTTQIHGFMQSPLKFMYLRHLSMEISFGSGNHRAGKNAVLQLAYLLDAAPLLVDLHLDIACRACPSRPSREVIIDHPHHYLKRTCITGFCGNGGQVALVKYILQNAVQLVRMVIDPKRKKGQQVDLCGARTAWELVQKDKKGVLMAVEYP